MGSSDGGTSDTTSDLSPFGPPKDSDLHTGANYGLSARDTKKKKAEDRKKAFEQARRGKEHPDYKSRAGSGIYSPVQENLTIAKDFERRAKESRINVPGFQGVALSTIQSINYSNIAAGLRSGGFAVTDAKTGDVVGVVNDGRYSGNVGFSPIGRTDAKFSGNQYSVTEAEMGGGENDAPQESIARPKMEDTTTTPRSPKMTTASRRALISGAGGSALRRNLL